MPLSTKQMEYLALAWQCFETDPKIDYEKFREVANLKSTASARELMRVTKNKLKEEYGALSGSMKDANAATAAGTPKKSTPAKKVGVSQDGTPTPSGRKRAAPGSRKGGNKAAAAKGDDGDGEGEGEEGPTKKIKVEVKAEPEQDEE